MAGLEQTPAIESPTEPINCLPLSQELILICTFAHLALIHVLQLASKAGASLSGELRYEKKGHPCFYHRRPTDIDARTFFIPSFLYLLQDIQSKLY